MVKIYVTYFSHNLIYHAQLFKINLLILLYSIQRAMTAPLINLQIKQPLLLQKLALLLLMQISVMQIMHQVFNGVL